MQNLPRIIYLNVDHSCITDADFKELTNVTWSKDKKNENDIKFVNCERITTYEDMKLILELCLKEAVNLRKGQMPQLYLDYMNDNLKYDKSQNRIGFSKGYVDLCKLETVFDEDSCEKIELTKY